MEENKNNKSDRSSWPVPGGISIGLGVGFFLVQSHPMALVGSVLAGFGAGLIISAILSRRCSSNVD